MYRTRIFYQDTDAGGVVYFANYLRFFEKSWFEHLANLGEPLTEWEKQGIFVMVKSVHMDLREKVLLGDEITVETRVGELGKAHFLLAHRVIKEGRAVTEAETKMVCVDGGGRLRRLPARLYESLSASIKEKGG